jgi:hypothetical protein
MVQVLLLRNQGGSVCLPRLATWTHMGENVKEDLVASLSMRQMVQVLRLPRGCSVFVFIRLVTLTWEKSKT